MILTGNRIAAEVATDTITIQPYSAECLEPNSYRVTLGRRFLDCATESLDARSNPLMSASVLEDQGRVLEILDSDEHDEEEGAPGTSIAFAILAAWTSGARDELDTADLADTVLNWITTHLGEPTSALARRAAGILGAPDAPDLTVNQLADELGPDFIPAMLWLATGLVAEYGSSDTAWLRRHDPHTDED